MARGLRVKHNNPHSAIINCIAEVAPSRRVVIYYKTVKAGCAGIRKPIFESLPDDPSVVLDDFSRAEIDVDQFNKSVAFAKFLSLRS